MYGISFFQVIYKFSVSNIYLVIEHIIYSIVKFYYIFTGLHDYHTIIKHPMDLGTVKRKMDNRKYKDPAQFAADVRLIFANCYRFESTITSFTLFCIVAEIRKHVHYMVVLFNLYTNLTSNSEI